MLTIACIPKLRTAYLKICLKTLLWPCACCAIFHHKLMKLTILLGLQRTAHAPTNAPPSCSQLALATCTMYLTSHKVSKLTVSSYYL